MINKAIIPAAGLGTRFRPATKTIPKEMFPIIDKPTLEYIIEEARSAGFTEIYVIINPYKEIIKKHFEDVHFIIQKEQKGLGHAIMCAKEFINDEPFAVLLGDDLVDGNAISELKALYEKTRCSILGVQKVERSEVSLYGIVEINKNKQVKDIVEKPSNPPSDYAVLGRYILTPKIFDLIGDIGTNNEIQLTDAIKKLLSYEDVYVCEFHDKRYDIGSKSGLVKAIIDFSLKDEKLGIKEYIRGKL